MQKEVQNPRTAITTGDHAPPRFPQMAANTQEECQMKPPSLNGIRSRYEKQFIGKPDRIGNYLIHQIGEQDCEPGYRCDPHVQWCYEISYVISGEGMTSIDGKEYEVHEGDLFITPVGVQHEVFSNHHFRYMFIGFSICNGALNDDTRLIDSFYQAPLSIL